MRREVKKWVLVCDGKDCDAEAIMPNDVEVPDDWQELPEQILCPACAERDYDVWITVRAEGILRIKAKNTDEVHDILNNRMGLLDWDEDMMKFDPVMEDEYIDHIEIH